MRANLVLILSVFFTSVYGDYNDDVDSFHQNIAKRGTLPTNSLNESCVSTGCPESTSGPCISKASPTAGYCLVGTFDQCSRRPLCGGYVLDNLAVPISTLSVAGNPKYGNLTSCTYNPDGYVSNFSHMQVTNSTLLPSRLLLDVQIPDVVINGSMNCVPGNVTVTYYHLLKIDFKLNLTADDVKVEDFKFSLIQLVINFYSPTGELLKSDDSFSQASANSIGNSLAPSYTAFFEKVFSILLHLAPTCAAQAATSGTQADGIANQICSGTNKPAQ